MSKIVPFRKPEAKAQINPEAKKDSEPFDFENSMEENCKKEERFKRERGKANELVKKRYRLK
jgi:hypothetical protein